MKKTLFTVLTVFLATSSGLWAQGSLSITDFSNKTARVGEEITITGVGFSADETEDSVAFGNDKYIEADEVNAGGTELKVRVPIEAETGQVKVKVLSGTPALSPTSLGDFTLTPLSISDFTPKTIRVGEKLTISGAGFAEYTGNPWVVYLH